MLPVPRSSASSALGLSCRVSAVDRLDSCCVLAAVGQGMVQRKGVAATMMGALAKANVNIKAIAQVSSSNPARVRMNAVSDRLYSSQMTN